MRVSVTLMLLLLAAVLTACGGAVSGQGTPTATVETGLNPVRSPVRVLAEETGLALEEITLLDSEQVEWTDGCFEAPQPGEVCTQVITPGFRISLDTPQGVYEIRTDASGEAYRILPPGEGPVVPTAIVWERLGGIAGICQRLTITFEGQYVLTDCANDHTLNTGQLPTDSWNQLSQWLESYGNFEFQSQIPEGSADMFADEYLFNGRGEQIPGNEGQQEINEFLGVLATDLASPPPSVTLDSSSGIRGQALRGPVCPGPQIEEGPEATECADQPYQATFDVLDENEMVITTFQTDEDGRFKVALAPANYTMVDRTDPNELFPRAEAEEVTVQEGEFSEVTIIFDTGIR